MAIKKLFKLAATTPVVSLTDTNYFYTVTAPITLPANASFVLSKSKWSNGAGTTPASFAAKSNGYYNMFINGVLQQSVMFTVNTISAVHLINAGSASVTIPASTPITLGLAKSSIAPAEVVVP